MRNVMHSNPIHSGLESVPFSGEAKSLVSGRSLVSIADEATPLYVH